MNIWWRVTSWAVFPNLKPFFSTCLKRWMFTKCSHIFVQRMGVLSVSRNCSRSWRAIHELEKSLSSWGLHSSGGDRINLETNTVMWKPMTYHPNDWVMKRQHLPILSTHEATCLQTWVSNQSCLSKAINGYIFLVETSLFKQVSPHPWTEWILINISVPLWGGGGVHLTLAFVWGPFISYSFLSYLELRCYWK